MAMTAQMVTIDCRDPAALATFWTAACDYVVERDSGEGEYVVLAPAPSPAPSAASSAGSARGGISIGLQRVPEPRAGKNRLHMDFAASSSLADEVARLVSLGASIVAEQSVPGFSWTVMADPEGNEFCVSSESSASSGTSSEG